MNNHRETTVANSEPGLRRLIRIIAALGLLLSVASCGGSGGGDGGSSGFDGSGDGGSGANTTINPDLPSGEVFLFNGYDGPRILDLRTGRYQLISGLDWVEPHPYNGLASFSACYSPDRQEIVETIDNCTTRDGELGYDDCIFIASSG